MAKARLPTEVRRRQIADAALRIIADEGPSGLTLVALGDAVGIADASVLKHFQDKKEIVTEAVARFGALLDEDIPLDIVDPLKRLGVFFVRRLTKIRARPELMRLAYGDRLRDAAGPESAAVLDGHLQRSARFVIHAIEEAQATGEAAADIPAQMWLWMIAGLFRGMSLGHPGGIVLDGDVSNMSPERCWELVEVRMRRGGETRGARPLSRRGRSRGA